MAATEPKPSDTDPLTLRAAIFKRPFPILLAGGMRGGLSCTDECPLVRVTPSDKNDSSAALPATGTLCTRVAVTHARTRARETHFPPAQNTRPARQLRRDLPRRVLPV
ncbi:hypothetical protein SKAU_G00390120 [Synaphobranchus kaupii]|uniref:Uncharacterized protein n=1 Tax=Synaphobranchus kaupii TaxID=118154 RepID=A0A9Q1ICP8_SYNKA|nr:hypothetical protein SKAU_G00390120 [Synaphobranchus kaupii]